MSKTLTEDRLVSKWLRDLIRLLPIRPQYVFSGNIRDVSLYPDGDGYRMERLCESMWKGLEQQGFKFMLLFDPVDGLSVFPPGAASEEDLKPLCGGDALAGELSRVSVRINQETLLIVIRNAVNSDQVRTAVVLDYASRIPVNAQHLDADMHRFYTACEKLSHDASRKYIDERRLFNPLVWLVNRIQDLPDWYTLDNDRIHVLDIPRPDYDQRKKAAEELVKDFSDYRVDDATSMEAYIETFADMTHGFSLQAMQDVAELAWADKMLLSDIDDAVRSYMTGDPALENPWQSCDLKERIIQAEEKIKKRVLGQTEAVEHAMDLLKRTVVGLTGAQAISSHRRPRGILFLAGPTGVGKTELAKSLTQEIFGNQQAYIRFDMSEFSAEHADQRLLGAPPGYVGYEAGGELTNAVRQRPFSLILFDEIEKSHARILDKFLQILEDGRLTSGRGETVYFSESIIVFTTNNGIIGKRADGSNGLLVDPEADYEVLKNRVRENLDEYFTMELKRPEILNRLGENIVVFDFIDAETAATILNKMLGHIKDRLRDEHGCELELSDVAKVSLEKIATAGIYKNGGRGIGNKLEIALINPLSRTLFDKGIPKGQKIVVTSIIENNGKYSVTLA